MAKQLVLKGDTSRIEYLFIQDSSSTTGAGRTGLVFNTASLVAYYVRTQGAATAITLATQTVTGAYSSGGFVEVDATNMPGVYRFDPPDAVFASGVDKAVIMLKGASNMAPVALEYQLVSFDPEDAAGLGLSRLDAAITTRLAPTVAARTLDVTATGAAGIDWGNVEGQATAVTLSATTVNDLTTKTGYALSAAGVDAIWDEAQSGHTTAGTFGKFLDVEVSSRNATTPPTAAVIADAVWDEARADHVAAGSFGQGVASVQGNVTGSAASVTGAVGSVTAAVTVGTNNDKSGYRLSATGVDDILDEAITEPAATFTWAGASLRSIVGWLGGLSRNKFTQNSTTQTLRNDADSANISTSTHSDDGTTYTRGEWS